MTYNYRCTTCKTHFSLKRPIPERNEPAVCPECGAPTGKRLFNDAPFFWSKPFTGQYTRGEIARAIAPETDEEKRIWKEYGA